MGSIAAFVRTRLVVTLALLALCAHLPGCYQQQRPSNDRIAQARIDPLPHDYREVVALWATADGYQTVHADDLLFDEPVKDWVRSEMEINGRYAWRVSAKQRLSDPIVADVYDAVTKHNQKKYDVWFAKGEAVAARVDGPTSYDRIETGWSLESSLKSAARMYSSNYDHLSATASLRRDEMNFLKSAARELAPSPLADEIDTALARGWNPALSALKLRAEWALQVHGEERDRQERIADYLEHNPNRLQFRDAMEMGQLQLGMSKDESRLSLGSPANISTHIDADVQFEVWTWDYPRKIATFQGIFIVAIDSW